MIFYDLIKPYCDYYFLLSSSDNDDEDMQAHDVGYWGQGIIEEGSEERVGWAKIGRY